MKRSEKFCFLDNVSKELSTLKIYNCRRKQDITNSVKLLKGWFLNISSLKGLSTEMRSLGIQKLATRRLNQDCLENFFGLMRRKGGLNDNPSACEFENNYKQAFCCFITIPSKSGANCEFDDAVILNTMNALKGLKSRNKENESVSEVSYGNPVFQNDEFIEQFSSLIQQNECNATVKPWFLQYQVILTNKQKCLVLNMYVAGLLKHFWRDISVISVNSILRAMTTL